MDLSDVFQPGMKREATFQIDQQYTAVHVGSGSLRVLATPSMIAFMEIVAYRMLEELLPDGYSNVGVLVNVRHLAPTSADRTIRVRCEIMDVDGRRVTFAVQAWDESEQVGEGTHQRVVIDVARFLQRVEAKG